MTEILIRSGGLQTTVQDRGRFGLQAMGIPPAGALDRDALETANLLVGNPRGEACLECTLSGPELEFTGPAVFAICGDSMGARLNGKPLEPYETLSAEAGDILTLGAAESGMRSYISFSGGLGIEPVLGSLSTYARGGFGGWRGRSLREGDRLSLGAGNAKDAASVRLYVPRSERSVYTREIKVRAIPSHETGRFEDASVASFFSEAYEVSPKSDRMGCRLLGTRLAHRAGADIISSGVQTGTVQVPGDGQPIVLLADRQTTGGYARIAHVIQADLPKLGQARPGDSIRFARTTVEAAREALLERERELLRTIRPRTAPVPQSSAMAAPAFETRRFTVTVNGRVYDVELRELL